MLMLFAMFWASGRMYVHARPSALVLFAVFWVSGCLYVHGRPSLVDAICSVLELRRTSGLFFAKCVVSEARLCCFVRCYLKCFGLAAVCMYLCGLQC